MLLASHRQRHIDKFVPHMNYMTTTSKPITNGAQSRAEHPAARVCSVNKELHIQCVCVCVCVQESWREIALIKVNKCAGIKHKSR